MGMKDYVFPGKTYDEWELGQEYITGARTITEADIVNFAGLSGDWSATHLRLAYRLRQCDFYCQYRADGPDSDV